MKINGFGNLTTECILLNFIEPVFFVKKADNGDKFITLLFDDEEGKYLLAKTNNTKILDMLNKNITMRELFENAVDNIRYIVEYDYEKKEYIIKDIKKNELTDDMLPEKGAFFELNNEEILKYKEKLEDESIKEFQLLNCEVFQNLGISEVKNSCICVKYQDTGIKVEEQILNINLKKDDACIYNYMIHNQSLYAFIQ